MNFSELFLVCVSFGLYRNSEISEKFRIPGFLKIMKFVQNFVFVVSFVLQVRHDHIGSDLMAECLPSAISLRHSLTMPILFCACEPTSRFPKVWLMQSKMLVHLCCWWVGGCFMHCEHHVHASIMCTARMCTASIMCACAL